MSGRICFDRLAPAALAWLCSSPLIDFAPMSIKLPCALFAVSLLAIDQAPARLGETADQCEKRYGKPEIDRVELPIEKRIIYRKDGRTVTVDFIDGKAVSLSFRKKGIEKWEIHEIDLKLREHGGGLPWGKPRASTSPIAARYLLF